MASDLDRTGGGEGTRTLGLYIANVALYQLSYTPGAEVQDSPACRPVPSASGGLWRLVIVVPGTRIPRDGRIEG